MAPKGFRRTSRPETYEEIPIAPQPKAPARVTTPQPPAQQTDAVFPMQFPDYTPKQPVAQVSEPVENKTRVQQAQPTQQNAKFSTGKIPVEQRVVNKDGKAMFLANVEILSEAGDSLFKLTTNSIGKWQAPLSPGKYQVKITKQGSLTKEKVDVTQNVTIDGLSPTQTLQVLICK